MKVLNQHASTKKKIIRGNNAPFMNKILSKANPTDTNKKLYNKQRNLCVSLLKKEGKSTTTI